MTARAVGEFRRTPIERADQRVAWERSDQSFFAAGACHVLAWACADAFAGGGVAIVAMRFVAEQRPVHVVASWNDWVFDHSGWNRRHDLIAANESFEGRAIECIDVAVALDDFCAQHHYRPPHEFWRDPRPRARAYVAAHAAPWDGQLASARDVTVEDF